MAWLLALLLVTGTAAVILEQPRDVTVREGSPATLHCRADTELQWYKDGLLFNPQDGNSFVLPDGSLFFLSAGQADTALYNCQDEAGTTSRPAALIVSGEDEDIVLTAEEEMFGEDREILGENLREALGEESELLPEEEVEVEVAPLEVLELDLQDEIPSSVYIVSMIIVAVLTVIVILGAAIIFVRVRRSGRNNSTAGSDKESTSPMMGGGGGVLQYPPHYQYILSTEYEAPVSRGDGMHYASSNILHSTPRPQPGPARHKGKQYRLPQPHYISPKENYNYFAC